MHIDMIRIDAVVSPMFDLPGEFVVVVLVVLVVGGTSTLQVRLAVLVEAKFKAS